MAISIESKFVSEAEWKDGFSIDSNHVFHLMPLTNIYLLKDHERSGWKAPKDFIWNLIYVDVQEFILLSEEGKP